MTETLPPRKQSSFAGDVAKLASGTLFAQILGILVTPEGLDWRGFKCYGGGMG